MATKQKRYICASCNRKLVESKTVLSKVRLCLKCHDLTLLGTNDQRCPELSHDLQKCPYDKLVAEIYSTPFWLDIRVIAPTTFKDMMFVRHGLEPTAASVQNPDC